MGNCGYLGTYVPMYLYLIPKVSSRDCADEAGIGRQLQLDNMEFEKE